MKSLVVWKIRCRVFAQKVSAHHLIVYPSESVFALGGNAMSPSVVSSIRKYKHKSLSQRKGFILLVSSFEEALSLGDFCHKEYLKILSEVPPNRPLTLIVKTNPRHPQTRHQKKIAIRIAENIYLKTFVQNLPFPLISTSLNPPKKDNTKSITRARVFAKHRGIKPLFFNHFPFTHEQTSRIYDLVEKKWVR